MGIGFPAPRRYASMISLVVRVPDVRPSVLWRKRSWFLEARQPSQHLVLYFFLSHGQPHLPQRPLRQHDRYPLKPAKMLATTGALDTRRTLTIRANVVSSLRPSRKKVMLMAPIGPSKFSMKNPGCRLLYHNQELRATAAACCGPREGFVGLHPVEALVGEAFAIVLNLSLRYSGVLRCLAGFRIRLQSAGVYKSLHVELKGQVGQHLKPWLERRGHCESSNGLPQCLDLFLDHLLPQAQGMRWRRIRPIALPPTLQSSQRPF